jgi:hypothetical protein
MEHSFSKYQACGGSVVSQFEFRVNATSKCSLLCLAHLDMNESSDLMSCIGETEQANPSPASKERKTRCYLLNQWHRRLLRHQL